MIVYMTEITEMPANCVDCVMRECALPLKARVYTPTIKKRYASKRHPDCPLLELPGRTETH